ncbi:MAG: fructose-1,6-bisphosphatase [Chloroflexi bacterium]|nr:fructose-1,6-bisphosphatase [Chloroflexota bacterium]
MKVTLSVIKADIGGYVGHSESHPECIAMGHKLLSEAKKIGKIIDYHVTKCGDDLELIMTHKKGTHSQEIHGLSWDVFVAATEVAKKLKLYGAGQDLLSDAFSGNIKGMGPGVAEMEIEERASEPVIIFMADKTSSGAWNLPLYKMFADPFNTAGLVIGESMHNGFVFEVLDVKENKRVLFNTPEEIYDLLLFIGSPARYMVRNIWHKDTKEISAVSSTQKLSYIAGKYVGKDDPVCIVRCQGNFPAVGEVLEPFAEPTIVEGWMRGSHYGPLMPVSMEDGVPTRFDGPPRVMAYGFQLADGMLVGPRDMFKDISFEPARQKANEMAYMLRKHGPFEPHRLPLEELEYTTLPQVMARLNNRWETNKD